MSTAAHGNDQRTIVHSENDWIRAVASLGQETLAQQWRSAKLGNDLAYFGYYFFLSKLFVQHKCSKRNDRCNQCIQ